MKNYKQYTAVALMMLSLLSAGCSSILREQDLLDQRDAQERIELKYLLSSIIVKNILFYQSLSTDVKDFSGAVQYIQGNHGGGANFFNGFINPQDKYNEFVGHIKMIQIAVDQAAEMEQYAYQGIFTIYKVLMWQAATDIYGDVIYSEALKGQEGILTPKYDKQEDIYSSLANEIKSASELIAKGKAAGQFIDVTSDVLYAGNLDTWIKMANSVRLRVLLRASRFDSYKNQLREAAAQPLISSAAESMAISYQGTTITNSFLWGPLRTTNDDDFSIWRPCHSLVVALRERNDPRLGYIAAPTERPWTTGSARRDTIRAAGYEYRFLWQKRDLNNKNIFDVDQAYTGYPAGYMGTNLYVNGNTEVSNTRQNVRISKLSTMLRQNAPTYFKASVINADEVQFMLAEAAVQGWINDADAKKYYEKGIELAMKRYGIDLPSGYLAQAKVAFPSTKEEQLKSIALQKWMGLFFVSVEAWADYRRTGRPALMENGYFSKNGPFENLWPNLHYPLRYRYPKDDVVNNNAAYIEAIDRMGVDYKGNKDTEWVPMWLIK